MSVDFETWPAVRWTGDLVNAIVPKGKGPGAIPGVSLFGRGVVSIFKWAPDWCRMYLIVTAGCYSARTVTATFLNLWIRAKKQFPNSPLAWRRAYALRLLRNQCA